MEGMLPRSNRKRHSLEEFEDDDSTTDKPPKQKKIRFPKGKKVKPGEEGSVNPAVVDDAPVNLSDPRMAAKERAKRRNQITAELFSKEINDTSAAEVVYEENDNFVEDGIQIEPFNLDKEREEGYFDAAGNFVEYVNENEIKDAWLDSVEVDVKYAGKNSMVTATEDDSNTNVPDLSSEDFGIIKRRIANALEPGETVLRALRRLKGSGNKKKDKMSAETQQMFDQLTEDANKLLDQGEYNVYHDMQEVFQREAEGYERLAQARGKSTLTTAADYGTGKDLFSNVTDLGASASILPNTNVDASKQDVSTAGISSNGADEYDMFADDDDNAVPYPTADVSNLVLGSDANEVSQPSLDGTNTVSDTGALPNDYVYDESSGYYYSSSLGYYYDPSTGLYCQATSGQWYSFNEETGTYDEVHDAASNAD